PIGNFNEHYKILLDQLPLSMKKDVWLHLTNCKNKPLSEEQIRDIHPNIEELLTREVNRYHNIKNRQKIKIEANTSSDGSSTLSQLDGFEKQLEKRELRVAEERKHLKDEYDALMSRKESEYNNCMVNMKQKLYSFKHQLENQHNSNSADLEKQYKSQITTLEKSIVIKVKRKCKKLEDVIFAKNLKIIALNDKIISYNPHVGRDATIEPSRQSLFVDSQSFLVSSQSFFVGSQSVFVGSQSIF
ncbi:233_t:CDS:2, partial [Funneliformis geosporum]